MIKRNFVKFKPSTNIDELKEILGECANIKNQVSYQTSNTGGLIVVNFTKYECCSEDDFLKKLGFLRFFLYSAYSDSVIEFDSLLEVT